MISLRQAYNNVLIELNKVKVPSLLLEDFVYFANKAIIQYVNNRYGLFEVSQQRTDDLDALRELDYPITLSLVDTRYQGTLPVNYMHILNCDVLFEFVKDYKCNSIGDTFKKSARKATSDQIKVIEDNYYFKPTFNRPYFYKNDSIIQIRSGQTNIAKPTTIYIDYIKTPTLVTLTQDELDLVEDTSQILEFPLGACQEIVNEITKLILENASDPRLQTNIPVSQSIGQDRIR